MADGLETFGTLNLHGNKAVNGATPTSSGDLVTKGYADGLLIPVTSGVFTVRVAATANITISTALVNGASLDGVTLATGDRVLVPFQTTGSQNGIYIVGVSPARAADADTGAEFPPGSQVYVQEGTAYGKTIFRNTNNGTSVTIGTTALTFATGAAWISVNGGVGFQNAWVDFDGGTTYQIAQYRRTQWNDVELRGLVKSGGVGATIFTLPSGYRPLKTEVFGVDTSANAHGRCDINNIGQVIPTSGSNSYFSLAGIRFSTL